MKSPELARKVFELLGKRSCEKDVEYMNKWDDLLKKYKIQYVMSCFHENSTNLGETLHDDRSLRHGISHSKHHAVRDTNEEDRLFNIMNSPKANNFIYIRCPYRNTDKYILKIPLKVATKMVVLGTLP